MGAHDEIETKIQIEGESSRLPTRSSSASTLTSTLNLDLDLNLDLNLGLALSRLMHIFLFSPIPYSFLHQRPQKLADQFVASGLFVTFVEPCGLTEYLTRRKKGLYLLVIRSVWYILLGLAAMVFPGLRRKPSPRRSGIERRQELIIVSMPIVVPNNRVNSALVERLNASIYRQALRKQFRQMDLGEESVAVVENPLWGLVLQEGDFTRVIYDCIDEISLFSGRGSVERMKEYERRLIGMSTAVCVTAEKLEENLRQKVEGRPLVRLPNGVDYQFFEQRIAEGGLPMDIAGTRRPIIGYVGVLRNWMDYELVEYLAKSSPHMSFVLVGPVDFEYRLEALRKIPNVILAGRKEYHDVPIYIDAFDVCIIPFDTGPVSTTTNPVKLFEYFALGKPVVATHLRELERFAEEGLLRMAESRRGFASAISDALAENAPGIIERRKQVAREHSWAILAERMLSIASAQQVTAQSRKGAEKDVHSPQRFDN